MASSKSNRGALYNVKLTRAVKIPKPKEASENEDEQKPQETELELPQTLVRIPTEHAPMLQPQSNSGDGNQPSED
jgi:DASH complex subunit DAD2